MRWIAIGCVGVLVFDTLGSLAARTLGFEYTLLLPGSLAIYFLTALLAARAERSIRAGTVAGAAVALTDATLGWTISWALGPGALDEGDRDALGIVATGLSVVAIGALIGVVAGWLAGRSAPASADEVA